MLRYMNMIRQQKRKAELNEEKQSSPSALNPIRDKQWIASYGNLLWAPFTLHISNLMLPLGKRLRAGAHTEALTLHNIRRQPSFTLMPWETSANQACGFQRSGRKQKLSRMELVSELSPGYQCAES